MHLTNYSVNKKSNFFDQSDDSGETGSKRSLKFLFDYFMRNKIDSHKVWKSIQVNLTSWNGQLRKTKKINKIVF